MPLRIGYVPEHFSTPLNFALTRYNLDATLHAYPSGTGSMVSALSSGELDVAIGLTEGWIAALGKGEDAFRLVGTYVETPLCWAISCGVDSEIRGVEDLEGKRVGVSRIGSGSYVMSYVLADQRGWNADGFEHVVLDTFSGLRDGVNGDKADFFMWEHFTSKRYYDSGAIRRVGEIYTPWSSWKIVAASRLVEGGVDPELEDVLGKINRGVKHFEENQEEAVKYISTQLDYSEEDAREWLKTVRFAKDVRGVDREVVKKTVGALQKAGVLGDKIDVEGMVAVVRE